MVFVIFSSVALLTFGAMAINFVSFDFSEEKLQHAADATAISTTYAVLLENEALNPLDIANRVASDFKVASKNQSIAASDIQFGRCAMGDDGKFAFQVDEMPYNATRVTARRSSEHQAGAIPVYFGKILGISSVNIECVATASYLEMDLAIVVDASGFMHGPDRFDEATRAFGVIMNELEKREHQSRVSLTVFSKDGDTIQPLTHDYDAVRGAYEGIVLRGPRDIHSGLVEGLRSIMTSAESRVDATKEVILLSECKDTSKMYIGDFTRLVRDLNAKIHVLTFSKVADDDIAMAIASGSGGEYYHKATDGQIADLINRLLDNSGVILCE